MVVSRLHLGPKSRMGEGILIRRDFSKGWGTGWRIYIYKNTYIYMYIYTDMMMMIIIMSRRRHWYPRPSLATSPFRSSPLAGLQGHIPYPHIAAGCMFELVIVLLPGHIWGCLGLHHLRACPCFSSSDLNVWFV